MRAKKPVCALAPLLAAVLLLTARVPLPFARAAEGAALLQSRVTDDSVLLYVRGADSSLANARIGVEPAPGTMIEGTGGTVETVTWLLVDNSLSIKRDDRRLSKELLTDLVAAKSPNERFILCTISDHLHPLLYDSSDYSELKKQIEAIEYNNQETYLTDVLSELLDREEQRAQPAFVRVLVISDGVDNNPGGITRAELEKRLRDKGGIPIYSVGCRGNAQELKEMYALSRQTGAQNWAFSELEGTWDVTSAMSGEEMPVCAVIPIPETLRDGSSKGVQLSFDNGVTVQTQVNMPFGSVTPPPPEPEPEPEPVPEPEPEPEPEPTLADKMREHWVLIVIGALLLLLLIPLVTVLRQRKRGRAAPAAPAPAPDDMAGTAAPAPPPAPAAPDFDERTVYMGAGTAAYGGGTVSSERHEGAKQIIVSLQDVERPEMRFEVALPVSAAPDTEDSGTVSLLHGAHGSSAAFHGEISIGRAPENDIVIDYNKTVSGRHCRILLSGESVRVLDLGSKNGTFVDGIPVRGDESVPARSDCTLELGDVAFRLGVSER